jgi:hypothetical protein
MKKVLLILLLLPAFSQANVLEQICKDNGVLKKQQFSENILSQVDFDSGLKLPIGNLFKSLGNCKSVESSNGEMKFEFEQYMISGKFALNNGQLTSIWFATPQLKSKNLDQLFAALKGLNHQISYFYKSGKKKIEYNGSKKMYVASTAKLHILEELKSCIKQKKCSSDDVLVLRKELKTSPSGELQSWPDDSKILVSSAANMMISKSDNTATDLVIDYLAKKKMKKFRSMQQRFIDLYAPTSKSFGPEDYKKIDLSKYASSGGEKETTENLCKLILKLKDSKELSINTDGIDKFERTLYKGGSRFGVLQKTYAWIDENKNWSCLSVTLNNPNGVNNTEASKIISNIVL